ncbi:MAG TPA: GNAT family N-acetyltransferase [Lentibacillus sp.]|jgi:predicted GNAT family N-acyltransferase|uniref:GNAT family N-acetyltransferase n=1 Tax=Lentibacillus sp. TaxID=1925746 RepID=UPI002B4B2AC1|nr:GNAT family N-acetyltransferase [Lentibacillus sp.]HLR61748.1 GNAT family N-acetyltransferase [Lentibacillus sp.]
MIIKTVETPEEKEQAYDVRTTVFVHEQNVPPEVEIDEFDEAATHLIGYEKDVPIAASRIRFTEDYGKLERICVLKDHRGRSHGSELIQVMEDVIRKEGFQKAKLNAQTHATRFYQRLGYEVISDEFMDAGIPHVTMTKALS